MTNITPPRTLTPEEEEWWQSYGRHLQAARKNFDRNQPIQRGLPEFYRAQDQAAELAK